MDRARAEARDLAEAQAARAEAARAETLAQAEAQVQALARIAAGQDRLAEALLREDGPEGPGQTDAESRMRLRSIDVQLLRILEEMSAGRQETLADLRTDIAALTAAIRQLGRSAAGRG
jgi:hypothetical protein